MVIGFVVIELAVLFILRKMLVTSFTRLVLMWDGTLSQAIWGYSIVTLPGVLLHEISHFLGAAFFGFKTGAIELLPVLTPEGGVELGSVQVARGDPIRLSLVGLAPLITGLTVIGLLSTPFPFSTLPSPVELIHNLTSLFRHTPSWINLYLIITISLHMFPSRKDMAMWPVAGLLLAATTAVAMWLGIGIPFLAAAAPFSGIGNRLIVLYGLLLIALALLIAALAVATGITAAVKRRTNLFKRSGRSVQWEH